MAVGASIEDRWLYIQVREVSARKLQMPPRTAIRGIRLPKHTLNVLGFLHRPIFAARTERRLGRRL
jgi:hypothetical protein